MFGRLPEMKDENGVNKNAICLSRGSRLYLFEYESGLNMITVAFCQRDLDINLTQPQDVEFYSLNRLDVLLEWMLFAEALHEGNSSCVFH